MDCNTAFTDSRNIIYVCFLIIIIAIINIVIISLRSIVKCRQSKKDLLQEMVLNDSGDSLLVH